MKHFTDWEEQTFPIEDANDWNTQWKCLLDQLFAEEWLFDEGVRR